MGYRQLEPVNLVLAQVKEEVYRMSSNSLMLTLSSSFCSRSLRNTLVINTNTSNMAQ
jgi:hypothetical protein